MNQDRLIELENIRDWQSLVEELEKGIANAGSSAAEKAALHLQAGRVYRTKFLSLVKALKHFQDAYKLNPQLTESLAAAREVYWELGKLNMVQKLLELELKAERDAHDTTALLVELGDVLCDQGEYDKATTTYARALNASGGNSDEARACLEDVQAESGSFRAHVAGLTTQAASAEGAKKARLLMRAARVVKRFAPDEAEALLEQAYTANPESLEIATAYEGLLAEAGRFESLQATQAELLESTADHHARGHLAFVFGGRWVGRLQQVDVGIRFLEDAVKLTPDADGAFQFLRDYHGKKSGDWDKVISIAEEAVSGAENGKSTFLLAQAATIAWRQLGNLIRARTAFERLCVVSPSHPDLKAFEDQIGEKMRPPNFVSATAAPPPPTLQSPESEPAETARGAEEPVATSTIAAPPPVASMQEPTPAPAPVSMAQPSAAGSGETTIAALRAQAEKQEGAKRYNEYVKTLLALAAAVPEPSEKVEYYMKAAELYVGKFANQAEAVKAYEQVLAIDPENQTATDYLRQMYEKRRDWEKLLTLERREADRLDGAARASKFLDMAKLATERIKKPDVCIELWNEVLATDDSNADALGALSALYERSKDFDKLVTVLEKQSEVTYEPAARIQILSKLGTLYGERLNNDEGAVQAWKTLLTLDPNDRKAQEALKKKYLALGLWDDLEVFYAESGKWDEFIRVLEQQETKETRPEAKIHLLFKIAELWADKKQKADRAARAYEKVLEIESSNLKAAEALIPIYSAAGNAKALANAIEVKLSHEEDDLQKVELLREVAALYEGKVKDPEKAFDRFLAAFAIAPGEERSPLDVERTAKATKGWDQVVSAYEKAIGDTTDPDLVVSLSLRLGHVFEAEKSAVDDALRVYRSVYDADNTNAPALEALERLYRQTNRFGELLEVYEKKRDLADDTKQRRAIQYEIARLFEEEVKDVDKAIDTFNQILDDSESEGPALAALDRLYGSLGRHEPHADILRRRIELDVPEQELVDLKYRLGQTQELHLGDPQAALENYREILFLSAGHGPAREALEKLLENEDLRADAAAILESIYEERADWSKLVRALEILTAAENDPKKRVALLRKIARIASDQLNDIELSFTSLSSALKDEPELSETRLEIEEVAERGNKWKDLVALYGEIGNAQSDARLARHYFMRVAQIAEQRLSQVDEAAAAYGLVLSLDAADSEALDALEALYERTSRWEDLIGVVQKRIELTSDLAVQEELYAKVATIYDEKLGRSEDSIGAYRKVLELEPSSTRALLALDQLFTRQKMWADLAANLEAQLALATTDQSQIALMLRLASLQETSMGEVDAAIEGYRTILERDLHNQEALVALERLGREPAHELTIADLLEGHYRQLGDYTKLIHVHEVQVKRAEDAARRVELLHQIAQLQEDSAGDAAAAFSTFVRALREEPSNDVTQAALERVARATGSFGELANQYEQLGKAAAEAPEADRDVMLASALLSTGARIQEEELQNLDKAIALYRTVLEVDPQNLPAVLSLERLFRSSERFTDLSDVLQKKSDVLEELPARKEALFQAASIEEDVLERQEHAIAVYKRVLELDEEDTRAVDALIRRYLGLSRWNDLLEAYQRKVDLVLDTEEKKRIFYQIGAVYERELSNVQAGIETYNKILELDPDDLQALSRLDVLYEQAENWSELLTVLGHEAELTSEPHQAISFRYRIAEIHEKRLSDVARAVELYREILQELPDHEPTIASLEALKNGDREPVAAASVLEPVYEASGDWQRLVSVHEVQVKHSDDAFQKIDLLHRIARLHEEALDNHSAAFDSYARALAVDSSNEQTLQNLERLAMVVNRWPDVAVLYDQELDKLTEAPERFVELALRTAQVYEVQLEKTELAIVRHRRVLEVDPTNEAALHSLDRLYVLTERWSDLVQILTTLSTSTQDGGKALEYSYRLGETQEKRLSNLDAAIEVYRQILESEPTHAQTLAAVEGLFSAKQKQTEIATILEPLYTSSGEWEKLAAVYEARLEHTAEPAERLEQYYVIANLHEERLHDAVSTLRVYMRALLEFPLDERAGEEAARLAQMVDGGWEELANTYADILGQHEDLAVQKSIGVRLARTFEDELADVTKAEETYAYVLGKDPKDQDALSNLDRIYLSTEAWQELAQILEMRVKATEDTMELVDLHSRLGEAYETRLGDIPNATRVYRRIFDELEKNNEGAITALERIYTNAESWRDLNVVFERQLELALGTSDEADIRAKIANLAATKLGEPERAIEGWKGVLDLRGEDSEALGALANLFEAGGMWRELADILERQSDIATSDDDRVNILTRRARNFTDQLQRDDLALEDWTRVLDIDSANLAALRAITSIRRRQQEPTELVSGLHMTVDRASHLLDEDELKDIYRELGKTYGERLGQPYDAADAWRHLIDLGPDFEAFDALDAIYRTDEKWEEVIDIKMQRAAALPEPAQQIEEYRAAAALWVEPLGNPDGATSAWQRILEVDAANDEAFTILEQLHSEAGRFEPLIELYLGRLETREQPSEKTELLRKIAKVFEEKLGDKNQALDALMQALEIDIFDKETPKHLDQMAQDTRRWPEVLNTVNGWLKGETDPQRKIRLCLLLAKWYGDDLNRPDYAQPMYAQIVQLDPDNVGALRQMAQLYRKSGDTQRYGQTLTKALEVAATDGDQKEILTELGELLETQMNQPEQALNYFQRALKVDGFFLPALVNLERIYETRGQNRELVDILQRKVNALKEPAEVAQTKLRVASLLETTVVDKQKAAQTYREVLEIEPSNLQALRGLSRVYSDLEQWPELVRTLETELEHVSTERERIDVLVHLAHLQEEKFLKADLAAAHLEQVLEIDPNHEDAYYALERNYRKLRLWPELIATYERHISATIDRHTKVELYGFIAQVYGDELDDADRAIDAYRNIVDIEENNLAALEALSRLFEKSGDIAQAVDYMGRVAELTDDPKQRVETFYRIARAMDEKLGDRMGAQDRYEMAIDIDPGHIPSLVALRQISMDNADYDKAAKFIDQEQSYTAVPRQRARLLVELGRVREELLQDHGSAVLAWEAAIEADPENEEAALPLADEFISTEQWERAEPLLELLVRKAGKRDRAEQHSLNKKLGIVTSALGKDDRALKAYTAAHQLDLTDQETIRGLADVSFRLQDWGAALTNYQKVLTALDESEVDLRADVYFRLGSIKKEQGQPKQAVSNYEKALGVLPNHRPTLEALVAIYSELKDWKQVVAYKRQILDDLVDGTERFEMLNDIADVWSEKDKNPSKAIEALEEAKDINPTDIPLLNKLLTLYPQTESWARMIDALQMLSEIEKDPIRKSKFVNMMAQLYRDKENDQDRAVELFNDALDLNPTFLEAFERINKILTNKKDWKGLERAFRKMLRRMSAAGTQNPDLEWNLWHNLGLIYRDRLQDPASAIEAFKMATRYKPDEPVERQILAELYEVTDQVEAAIGEHWHVLQKDPMRVDPYRSLYRLALKLHDYDRAWTLCAALSFLGKADEEEKRFFDDYRPKGMIQVKSRLDNEQWVKNLFHKDENLYIGKIFEMVTPAAIVAKQQALARAKQLPQLDPRFRQDPQSSTVTFAKTFGWAAQVLGVPAPELYIRNDVPGALMTVPSSPPATVAGQTVLTGFTPQELTFIVGKHLSGYRGEHYIKNLFPTLAELKVVLFAGIKVILSDFAVPADMAQAVNGFAMELAKSMRPIERDSLRIVVQKFVEDGARADLKRWMQTVDVTAARSGLLLCGDLDIAKKIIAAEPQLPGDLTPGEKMKELLIFSVGEQYLQLRKTLGISVGSEG
ncbi:MAG: hypothetical protein U0174_28125 [Polyangiaceae bacterium]